jgi:hypothetical protein
MTNTNGCRGSAVRSIMGTTPAQGHLRPAAAKQRAGAKARQLIADSSE